MPRTFEDLAIFAAPGVFVVLWASGFIGAKFGLPYAEPLTFLSLRMVAVVALLGLIVLITRPPWPDRAGLAHSAATGLMVHGLYLGGVFVSIENGMPAGLIALVVSLQPVLTSTIANRLLGERVVPRQWFGLLLGLIGVYLIVHEKTESGGTTALAWVAAVVALLGMTAGTLYQKRFGGGIDWRPGMLVQYAAAGDAFRAGRDHVRVQASAMDARIPVRARLARLRAVVRRDLAAVFSHSPLGGDARGEPVLSHAAVHGADGVGAVRRAPCAARARLAWRSASPGCSW